MPTESGDLRLKYYNGKLVSNVDDPNAALISNEKLTKSFVEQPFFSFSITDYEATLPAKDVQLVLDQRDGN